MRIIGSAKRVFPLAQVLNHYFDSMKNGLRHEWQYASYKPKPGRFHISGTGRCLRQRVLERAEYEKAERRLESKLVLLFGDSIEGIWWAALKHGQGQFGYRLHYQVRLDMPKYQVSGTLDTRVQYRDGFTSLLDCKSASAKSLFWTMRDQGKRENKMQLGGYAEADIEQGSSVDSIELHYIGKEYGELAIVCPDMQEWRAEAVKDWEVALAAWQRYQKDGTLPDEVPLSPATKGSKHVKSGRVKTGEPAPHGLCSPLYCDLLSHCKKIRGWWDDHPLNEED